jgi:hypothetical protein
MAMARSTGGKGGKPAPTPIGGGNTNDSLLGGASSDTLLGNDGNDTLTALGGNDVLNGGNGNDVLTGGAGRDTFVFSAGNDVVTDFDPLTRSGELIDAVDPALVAITNDSNGDIMLLDGATGGTMVLLGWKLADFSIGEINHWIV